MVKRGCENQSVTEIRKSMVKNEALLACFVNAWSNATIDLSNFGSEILNQKTCYLIKYLPICSNDLIFSWNCLKMKPYEMDVSYYRSKNPVWILHKMSNIHLLLDGWKKQTYSMQTWNYSLYLIPQCTSHCRIANNHQLGVGWLIVRAWLLLEFLFHSGLTDTNFWLLHWIGPLILARNSNGNISTNNIFSGFLKPEKPKTRTKPKISNPILLKLRTRLHSL